MPCDVQVIDTDGLAKFFKGRTDGVLVFVKLTRFAAGGARADPGHRPNTEVAWYGGLGSAILDHSDRLLAAEDIEGWWKGVIRALY